MSSHRVTQRLALVALLALTGSEAAACDFCTGGGRKFRSLQLEVESNATVALAHPIGRNRFKVEKVLHGRLAVGAEVVIEARLFFVPGATFLLLGEEAEATRVIVLRGAAAAFVEKLTDLPVDRTARLQFFLPYLTDSDPYIAASARQEFADAPYAEVKKLKPHMTPETFLKALASRSTPRASRGILLLMVGVSGSTKHIEKLEPWLADETLQQKPDYDALIAAYLLLRGPDGLAKMREVVAAIDENSRARPAIAFMKALRFHEREEKVLARAQIIATLRWLLRYPAFADATLFELQRHEDWEALPLVIELYEKHAEAHPSITRPVQDYSRACPGKEAAEFMESIK